jgi:2-amino-4-hydroxy-6-hydroxymethyldihydropteridine diphosphokinase
VDTGGIYIGLGSNLGDRAANLRAALAELNQGNMRVLRCSSFHETQPVGGPPGQKAYLNAVCEVDTQLDPRALLERLQMIEARLGRVRTVRNGPRTLDLDLLLYRDYVIDEPELTVPHPRMWERSFVLDPLAEICPRDRLAAARPRRARPARD